jgi:hypothetical protein
MFYLLKDKDYKSFTIVIYNCNDSMIIFYDCNDSGHHYKTMVLVKLALARSVNYDRNVMLQIEAYLLRLYDRKSRL